MTSRRVPLRCVSNLYRESVNGVQKEKSLKSQLKKQSPNNAPIVDLLRKSTNQRRIEQENSLCNTSRSLNVSGSSSVSNSFSLFDVDDVPEELSTFFESSTVEDPVAKSLRPRCETAANIFPGDDLFVDIPWLGVQSPTFSRKRKACPVARDDSSDVLDVSCDAEDEAIEDVRRPTARKRRKFITDDPEFKEWLEKINAEFSSVEEHDLLTEETTD